MPKVANREYRSMIMATQPKSEKRFDSAYYVEGYAARFEPYVLYETSEGPVHERFERDCFVGCDMSDVIMQYDHSGRVYARQSNNTLYLNVDDEGLFIAADLSSTEGSKQLYEDISAGLITKMSWAFVPLEYRFDKDTRTIVYTKIKKIYDVSAVSIPANDSTSINARAFADGEIERMAQELRNREKLALKLKLGGF